MHFWRHRKPAVGGKMLLSKKLSRQFYGPIEIKELPGAGLCMGPGQNVVGDDRAVSLREIATD